MTTLTTSVPFFRPCLSDDEIGEVVDTLSSGWLTTGPKTRLFETEFAQAVSARHAVAVNSCTAALHLAIEALGLRRGDAVLVPTMTFAATAEVVRYLGAVPLLVDCEPATLNLSLEDAAERVDAFRSGRSRVAGAVRGDVVGMIPVHVGGRMMDVAAVARFAAERGLWVVEDAAHAFPAAWRASDGDAWQWCGQHTAAVTCFSFYANKTITTGEGGMAVSDDTEVVDRMRTMSLHGLSRDAWNRYSGGGWDYKIIAPGFKYNMTDIAAAIGLHQLRRAESLRLERQAIARQYAGMLAKIDELELPEDDADRIHSWHLFPIRLRLDKLTIERNDFVDELKARGVATSVHWRPLHLHPYYQETYGWTEEDLPAASAEWKRLISLPIFPGMRPDEVEHVVASLATICAHHRRPAARRHTAASGRSNGWLRHARA